MQNQYEGRMKKYEAIVKDYKANAKQILLNIVVAVLKNFWMNCSEKAIFLPLVEPSRAHAAVRGSATASDDLPTYLCLR